MIAVLIGLAVSLVITFIGTPIVTNIITDLHYGQYIRQDGPQSHMVKRGTPTMGGIVINIAIVFGWLASALYRAIALGKAPSVNAILVLFVMLSMGLLGFIDDFAKVAKKQNEGLTIHAKLIGQIAVATIYAILSLTIQTPDGQVSAHSGITFIEKPFISFENLGTILSAILFIIWVNLLIAAWTNAINLTDGLDGLASGSSMVAFLGFAIIGMWQTYHRVPLPNSYSYTVQDPQDLTIIALCAVAACFGFLWFNSNPATIFMGDTGSLALGGLFAALSIATHTEVLAVMLGALFVWETVSDVIQIFSFKVFHKRVFKMAPIHHHYELKGWSENKVVVRFWMIEMVCVIIALVIFYLDWVIRSGI
ncbi:phospho-N-acetylmuramoyl-pentapeptide-transferase [Alloscardovia theropitheci]|uniref:Phospho-N-acetylmuramoyl-pentapeptide-transferase n=1 Tax=Alloscardovia theropitheci TaxID=2496842 RepID=A0A4R0QRH5_9BIFI|nr:phospho-N-acetylmuramoyl-pentapeptide-transferase [Alloscardovia theropitheci]TCD53968.1 phospho-N-acetylmuramoyl-pentapeptide-transferase [Alloscardovia theropitheci]